MSDYQRATAIDSLQVRSSRETCPSRREQNKSLQRTEKCDKSEIQKRHKTELNVVEFRFQMFQNLNVNGTEEQRNVMSEMSTYCVAGINAEVCLLTS